MKSNRKKIIKGEIAKKNSIIKIISDYINKN
jgi:hypothetical protein